jgi:hypothetical protein
VKEEMEGGVAVEWRRRRIFQTNEVATDYNAGFQSALAGLNKIYG